ncbi:MULTISPECIES: hypothetical protein [Corynebacterium]|uniref:Uncharacterized protein n=1 Tax=Corynebacterium ramonii TaxID=3026968 RepID=A0ABN4ED38_9CORY|nr:MULTISPECIES: hypothetical protein [Corynebacterium]AIU31696.1 Hypothetical protein CulFRC11_0091 [Corynebacterium ramonii FRC0011]ESU59426.1 hypothetical protein D881_00920 [Corynebacterium ulcerans NCTC 12077]STC80050.1 Uncharacterised protein [Corynebacterium ulcerans]
MIFALDTYFVANESDLGMAYRVYSRVVNNAAKKSGIDILFICAEPAGVDSEEMQNDLISQFRIERPAEDFENLRLYLCTAIVSASGESATSEDKPLASFFLMDEEYVRADAFPSSVGCRKLVSWKRSAVEPFDDENS